MTKRLPIFLLIFLLTACMTNKKTKQWSLNQAIGWENPNPEDFAVLFVKSNESVLNADQLLNKRKFDEAILKEFEARRIGSQAENDEKDETDFHYVVSTDYSKAVAVILTVAKNFNQEQQITVYKRDYKSFDKWTDTIIYPK